MQYTNNKIRVRYSISRFFSFHLADYFIYCILQHDLLQNTQNKTGHLILTSIDNGLVRYLQHKPELWVHGVGLFGMHAKEGCIKSVNFFQFSISSGKAIQTQNFKEEKKRNQKRSLLNSLSLLVLQQMNESISLVPTERRETGPS